MGAALVALGLTSFLLIMSIVFPSFRHGDASMYFHKYYGHLGGSLTDVAQTVLMRPAVLAHTLLEPAKLKYLAALLLPFLLIHVRKPVLLLPALPAILLNLLSNHPSLTSRSFHYEAEIYPALFATSVVAFTQVRRYRALWLSVLLVACVARSPVAMARDIWITEHHRRLARQLTRYAPHDRSIAAPQIIAAHLTDREKLYMFDYFGMEEDWRRAQIVLIGFAGPQMGMYPWHTLYTTILPRMERGMRLVFQDPDDPRFRLYQTTAPKSSLPAVPTWRGTHPR
jgi:hypothetical protein